MKGRKGGIKRKKERDREKRWRRRRRRRSTKPFYQDFGREPKMYPRGYARRRQLNEWLEKITLRATGTVILAAYDPADCIIFFPFFFFLFSSSRSTRCFFTRGEILPRTTALVNKRSAIRCYSNALTSALGGQGDSWLSWLTVFFSPPFSVFFLYL